MEFILFVLVGGIIGIVGGGGGIFAVPILVYAFGIDPLLATFYSMILVGSTSLVGTIRARRQIAWKVGLLFALPSIVMTLIMRRYGVPALPDPLFGMEKWTALLIFFAMIMFASSCALLCKKKWKPQKERNWTASQKTLFTLGEWGLVGLITGLVGAGGGFIIVPALILLEWLESKRAILTSMFIITLNTLIGAIGNIPHDIDISFLAQAILLSLVGLWIGMYYQKRLSGATLSRGFAYFTGAAAIIMLVKELFFS